METRNLFFGLALAILAFFVYAQLYSWLGPKPAPPRPPDLGREDRAASPTAGAPDEGGQASRPATAAVLKSGGSLDQVVLGGNAGDRLQVTLTPLGAGIESIRLTERDAKGRYVYRAAPDRDEAVQILRPVRDGSGELHHSYTTRQVWSPELGRKDEGWRLDDIVWEVSAADAGQVTFATTLASADTGEPLLRILKRFALVADKPLIEFALEAVNLTGKPLTVEFAQDGPLGIHREHAQYDMRYLMSAARGSGGIELSTAEKWPALQKATVEGQAVDLFKPAQDRTFLWTGLGNKFFAVFTRPLPAESGRAVVVRAVKGLVAAPDVPADASDWLRHGDLLARLYTVRENVPFEGERSVRYAFEIYAGPKDGDVLRRVNAAYVDQGQLGYGLFHGADLRCFCVPIWLTDFMTWLLQSIKALFLNGGVAIIILVLIVRTILHPLAVFQQKSMYKMQEGMLRLQPKLEAIKEKYPDDKVKQNQETMRVYSEEGINPAAGLVGMLPLMLQIPILGALWTALNTDIHLRHAPLDGWWIRDLSAPDALVPFSPPMDIPILSWLPFVGYAFAGVTALNLLPILMGVSMWLQQKYMPKPAMQARLEAARTQSTSKKPSGGLSPEDQMRQQQMMAYMMSFMFPLMFYYMPAGLNLYWMATNVFGICESLIIRRQLERERERREREGPRAVEKREPGMIGRFLRKLATQAEELQKKADELSKDEKRRDVRKAPDQRKRGAR